MENIRSSMLPTYLDCSRMAAASQFSELIKSKGYEIPEFNKSKIYTILGTCNHSAAEYLCTRKIQGKQSNRVEEFTLDKFDAAISVSENLEYEEIIPNQNHAVEQIKRFIKIYEKDVLPKMVFPENADPNDHIELSLRAKIKGYDITGHIDTLTKYSVSDIKTGKKLKPFHTQFGCYDLLLKANEKGLPKWNILIYIKRVHKDKPYPGTQIIKLDTMFCYKESHALILKIIDDLDRFKINGDSRCFTANPQSALCSNKYCRAYGTDFCGYFKGEK